MNYQWSETKKFYKPKVMNYQWSETKKFYKPWVNTDEVNMQPSSGAEVRFLDFTDYGKFLSDFPGFSKEDLLVTLEHRTLTIVANNETRFKKQTFVIPKKFDCDSIDLFLVNGELEITVDVLPTIKQEPREIKVR